MNLEYVTEAKEQDTWGARIKQSLQLFFKPQCKHLLKSCYTQVDGAAFSLQKYTY